MSKRFTATEKWTDPWFCGLSDNNKLFWLYILDNCDNAGIWRVNWFLFGCYVKNYKYDPEIFKDRIIVLDDEKWFIPKFVEFQYGKLNPNCVPHISVIKLLEKHTLCIPYLNSWLTPKDKDKDKEEDKSKRREENKETSDFDTFWKAYPHKVGKGAALKAWEKAKPNLELCLKAISWQKNSQQWVKDGGQFIPHPSTWINQKRWLDEPIKSGQVSGNYSAPVVGKYDNLVDNKGDSNGKVR